MLENLRWKKYPVLNDGYICLVDVMGNDSAIVQAARVSYGKDYPINTHRLWKDGDTNIPKSITDSDGTVTLQLCKDCKKGESELYENGGICPYQKTKDRGLIRRLMMDSHTSPFEMVEFKFKIRVPMDCWRQWIRHRTANVNEYSTRYSEAIDSQQTTSPEEWRLQAKDNKQGSSGFLEKDGPEDAGMSTGAALSADEKELHETTKRTYQWRLRAGVAREQARKDLPLSTYTEAYWKCDLHNIFNFLRLRLDPHAQLEIRLYAEAMFDIVKQVCPIASEAFSDYVLESVKFSYEEMKLIKRLMSDHKSTYEGTDLSFDDWTKPDNMTDNEWTKFLQKVKL